MQMPLGLFRKLPIGLIRHGVQGLPMRRNAAELVTSEIRIPLDLGGFKKLLAYACRAGLPGLSGSPPRNIDRLLRSACSDVSWVPAPTIAAQFGADLSPQ